MYNILCVQTHNIRNISFWQLVNKTADCFNNIFFISVAKISSKEVCEKMESNSTLEKVLLVCNRNAELLRLVVAIFDFKVSFLKWMRKKNFICLSLLTFELSNINWKCSENCNILTKRTYDSAIFKIFLNIITIFIVIEQ